MTTSIFVNLPVSDLEASKTFYTALGYEIFGEPFVEVTLPHRKMRKTLRVSI